MNDNFLALLPIHAFWRLLVDQSDQEQHGPDWLEGEEPGYLKSMFHGLNFILSTLDQDLSVDYLIQTHDHAVAFTQKRFLVDTEHGVQVHFEAFPQGLRKYYGVEFGLSTTGPTQNCTWKGVQALLQQMAEGDTYFSLQSDDRQNLWSAANLTLPIKPELVDEVWSIVQSKPCMIAIAACSNELLNQRIQSILAKFKTELTKCKPNDDSLLYAIASCIQALELTHPFPDGNCRTFAVLILNQLLLKHHQPPTVLRCRDRFDAYAIDELVEEIRLGQNYFLQHLQSAHSMDLAGPFYGHELPSLAKLWFFKIISSWSQWPQLKKIDQEKIQSIVVQSLMELPMAQIQPNEVSSIEEIILNTLRRAVYPQKQALGFLSWFQAPANSLGVHYSSDLAHHPENDGLDAKTLIEQIELSQKMLGNALRLSS